MLGPLAPKTIDILAAGKLLFFLVLTLGVFAYPRLEKPKRWLVLGAAVIGVIIALQVLIFRGAPTVWNQLSGDDLFVTSFYQRVVSDGSAHDFAYFRLPPFYPPMFFYAIGRLGALLGLSGIGAAKLGVLVATALVPLVIYMFLRALGTVTDRVIARPLFALFLTLVPFAVVDYPSILTKPYEFISALGVLLWFLAVNRGLSRTGRQPRWRQILAAGIVGAVLFSTYYLWFAMVAIAVVVACPWRHFGAALRHLLGWATIGAVVAFGTMWYWGPLVVSYWQFGMENWQPAFFVPADFNFFPPLEFSLRSLWMWAGLFSLLQFRRDPLVRDAGMLLGATYVWQAASLVATLVGHAPFEASRGFTFLGEVILGFGAAYGVARWISPAAVPGFSHIKDILQERFAVHTGAGAKTLATKFFGAWLMLSLSLPFGVWLDQESTKQRIDDIRTADPAIVLFTKYFQQHSDEAKLTTLSFMPKLSATVPVRLYVNHNQHTSHPAANFSRRLRYLEGLAAAPTAEEFYKRFVNENPYEPIEQLVLYAYQGNYELYFWLDDYPNGGREYVVRWPQSLIAEPYFIPVPGLSIGGFQAWRPVAVK